MHNSRSWRRLPTAIAVAAVVAGGVSACAGTSSGTSSSATGGAKQQSHSIKIGGVMFARDIEYWQLIEAGMKAAAEKDGAPIDVEVSNRNLATESSVVDTFHAKGDNVLVISPYDAKASVATLKKARNAGMTVLQYNTQVDDPVFKYFVGVDNKQLGSAVGKALVRYVDDKLGGKATVGVLAGDTEPGGTDRKNGFLSALKGHAGIKVATTVTAVGSPTDGANAFNTALQGHPNIDVVWAWNGSALQGAAVSAAKAHRNVKIFGVDMSSQVAGLMRKPSTPVVAVADQHAYNVGYQAVQDAVKLAKGQSGVSTTASLQPEVYQSSDPAGVEQYLRELHHSSR